MSLQDIRYWLEDLDIRKKLEGNQSITVIALLVVIVLCLSLVVCQFTGGGGGNASREVQLVYFDTDSQTIKLVDHTYGAGEAPPASPLEGTQTVFKTSVFKCEQCPKGTIKDGMTLTDLKDEGMFLGWLQRDDPKADPQMVMHGAAYAYRTLESDRWYKLGESGYQQIIAAPYERCPNARECQP